MRNYFATLNDALRAEGLIESWDCMWQPIHYNETRRWIWQDGTRHGHMVSVYRDDRGMYERPVHYKC